MNDEIRQQRLLVVSPYAPSTEHRHAAADYVIPLLDELRGRFDLHVAAPGVGTTDRGYAVHDLPVPRFSLKSRFGLVSAAQRMDWTQAANVAVGALVDRLRPDIVHFEYLQAAEAGLALDCRWTCTLHDITEQVMRDKIRGGGVERLYRTAEWLRTLRLERSVIRSAEHVFVHNPKNVDHVARLGGSATATWMGVSVPQEVWSPSLDRPPTVVFAGAMWREPNRRAAEWLIDDVMPKVWAALPSAVLRIVGYGSQQLRTSVADGRVELVGDVETFEKEYLRASVVAAPSTINVGVLVKAQKAMAVGAPVVLNSRSAEAFRHLDPGAYAVADDPSAFAISLLTFLTNPEQGQETGQRGRQLVQREFGWPASVDVNVSVWRSLRSPSR